MNLHQSMNKELNYCSYKNVVTTMKLNEHWH